MKKKLALIVLSLFIFNQSLFAIGSILYQEKKFLRSAADQSILKINNYKVCVTQSSNPKAIDKCYVVLAKELKILKKKSLKIKHKIRSSNKSYKNRFSPYK